MNRREFLQCMSILVGGGSVSHVGFALSQEQEIFLASQPDFNTQPVDYLTPVQRQIIAAMA